MCVEWRQKWRRWAGGLRAVFGSGEPQHTRHGGPKPANYAAQGSNVDLPEPPREVAWKTSEGVCVPRVWPGKSLRGCDAGPAGNRTGGSGCWRANSLLVALHAGEDVVGEYLFPCARPRPLELLRCRDACSRNASEPTTLVCSILDLMLLWGRSWGSLCGCRNRNLRPGYSRPPRKSQATKAQAGLFFLSVSFLSIF